MTDLLADPDYADRLMTFLTDAFITRIRAYRERLGQELKPASYGFADDSIQLMSTDMVKERVLPHYLRLKSELSRGESVSMHLCGNATRHFPMLRDELGVRSFDTGFPVDFGWLREAVGDEVEILGGPSVPFLETSNTQQTTAETKRILETGIMRGGKFILREGNNLPRSVPMENVWAMYDAAKEYGRY
jgi:uroporphyrinogen-III decarboxylase